MAKTGDNRLRGVRCFGSVRRSKVPGAAALVLVVLWGGSAVAQDPAEMAAARAVLLDLQGRSFAEDREYCGYIGVMPDGTYMATEVTRGRSHSCLSRGDESRFMEVTASFHTHGGFHWDADSEVPSVEDMLGDMEEGVNGYVATPGGRFWYIDGVRGVAYQICGLGCLGQDPDFVEGAAGAIAVEYTLDALRSRGW
jgi:hypothetical protein